MREQLCEAWFYIAMQAHVAGRGDESRRAFQKCRDTGVHYFFEHPWAVGMLRAVK